MPFSMSRNVRPSRASGTLRWVFSITALSLLTLLIQGYHPLSEDGGLYVAGVQYTLDPGLFPHYTAFVTEHLSYSIFAPVLAALVRVLHLSLDWVLLLTNLFSLALTFFVAHQLLRRCVANATAQLAGLALLVAWWTLPIAGTSLMLMDPYVTARSLSTPLTLLAIAFALDDWSASRTAILCVLTLAAAAVFHPLMAAYAAVFVIALRCARWKQRNVAFAALTLAALLSAYLLHRGAPTESPAVAAAAVSRYYWFLSQWQWFELLGLAGPLLVLVLLLRYRRANMMTPAVTLVRTCLFLGLLAVAIALLFCHQNDRAHLVARMQPLRLFLPIYAVMTLLLGATLTDSLLRARTRANSRAVRVTFAALPVILFISLAAIFFLVQRTTYPGGPHIEFPGREARNRNPWVQAFRWARTHTPKDALFALDAKYVNQDGEDAQTFRAWSLRSALPDFSKDGGEAAITPLLANSWFVAAEAQKNLSMETDAARDPRILPLGATWMIVHASTATNHVCPYANATVKVCSLMALDISR